jgi:DNA-binding beta-propeller fold protein YncE
VHRQLVVGFRRAVLLLLVSAACTGGSVPPSATRLPPANIPAGPSTQSPTRSSPLPSPRPAAVRDLVWAAIESGGAIVQVDVQAHRVVARQELPGGPHNITVAQDGTVVVALPKAGQIALVRGRRVRRIRLGGSPHDVKIAGNLVVVANEGAARLDLVRMTGRIAGHVRLKANPHDLAITPDGLRAWVSLDGLGGLAVVDLASRRVVRYVSTAQRPHDLLFSPRGRLWVTDWTGGVWVYAARGRPVGRILAGIQVHHLAFTPDGQQAWLTDHDGSRLFVVDALDLRVLDSLRIAGAPHHVTLTPDGRWAVVADHDQGTLLIFAVASRRLVAYVPVGTGPHGVWAVP